MKQPEGVFFRSTLGKILTAIDKWKETLPKVDGSQPKEKQPEIARSFRQIIGG